MEIIGNDETKNIIRAEIEKIIDTDPALAKMIHDIEKSPRLFKIVKSEGLNKFIPNSRSDAMIPGKGSGGIIYWNPRRDVDPEGWGKKRDPKVGLVHELQHAWDTDKGLLDDRKSGSGVQKSEERAVRTENIMREKTGFPIRRKYSGISFNNPEPEYSPMYAELKKDKEKAMQIIGGRQ